MNGCVFPDCASREVHARGLCWRHYYAEQKGGRLNNWPRLHKNDSVLPLLSELDITYRQFDYWARSGQIVLEHDANGSGSRRGVTDDEAVALREFVTQYKAIQQAQEDFTTGRLWARIKGEQ